MMTAVPLDASLIEASQVGAVLLETPTHGILVEITAGVGAERRREVGGGLVHEDTQCEIRASSNFVGTFKGLRLRFRRRIAAATSQERI
jgi:hypothetical protein